METGSGGRVQGESAPVTQGLENARVGELVSQLCWVTRANYSKTLHFIFKLEATLASQIHSND